MENSQATPSGFYQSPTRRRLMRSNNSPSSGLVTSPSTIVSAISPQAGARRPLLFNRTTARNLNEDSEHFEHGISSDPLKILSESEARNSRYNGITIKRIFHLTLFFFFLFITF